MTGTVAILTSSKEFKISSPWEPLITNNIVLMPECTGRFREEITCKEAKPRTERLQKKLSKD